MHTYIISITGETPKKNLSSIGTMKRKIMEMIFVHKKVGSTSMKTPYRPMFGFYDSMKVGGIPNEIFPLVISATIRQFDDFQLKV